MTAARRPTLALPAALLVALLAAAAGPGPGAAYEFPFNLVKFRPVFRTLATRHLDLSYPPGLTAETTLRAFAETNDRLLETALAEFGLRPPARRLPLALYPSPESKRKLTGSAEPSQLEDGTLHLVFAGPGQLAGDLLPLALGRLLGRSESAFLNLGLRHLHEPVYGGRLTEDRFPRDEVERAFAEFGLHRPVRDALGGGRDALPLDDRARVTASGFVRFLLEAYGPANFRAWYPGDASTAAARFLAIYGFGIADAETQWREGLLRRRLPDDRHAALREALDRLGYRVR